jgi:hypothetical protein
MVGRACFGHVETGGCWSLAGADTLDEAHDMVDSKVLNSQGYHADVVVLHSVGACSGLVASANNGFGGSRSVVGIGISIWSRG